ncbi:MAG: ParB N-terminal domain-containing protein [Candidatus Aminicenantes bacterium]|nr:ParB N-terminal domain-containing protein [Candidatus Aminicenantes bacterium]NIQ72213.1 ParB N-terminal domain-containing protein [Candidatus Aminicenantes bacterium]NIT28249.1 ParB N-terminal domain-containing protein [Candidatus Aminicenantes bacterium]
MKKQKVNLVSEIEHVPIKSIKPYLKNPKKHPPDQIEKIKKSIQDFGFNVPILIRAGEIVAGHGRLMAAEALGLELVPIIKMDHLDPLAARAFLIADNKTAISSFDDKLLAAVLQDLAAENYPLETTAIDITEINRMLEGMVLNMQEPKQRPGRAAGRQAQGPGGDPAAGHAIALGGYTVLVDNGTAKRLKDFSSFMAGNPQLKNEIDNMIKERFLELAEEVLPA